jgi:hypothetical protein
MKREPTLSSVKAPAPGIVQSLNDTVRFKLQRAILDNDGEAFRNALMAYSSELAGQHRLYGVLVMTPDGMRPFMVNEKGERIGSGFIIAAGTPIELLNVEFGPDGMTATTPDGFT